LISKIIFRAEIYKVSVGWRNPSDPSDFDVGGVVIGLSGALIIAGAPPP
jgi:hypothetical protein